MRWRGGWGRGPVPAAPRRAPPGGGAAHGPPPRVEVGSLAIKDGDEGIVLRSPRSREPSRSPVQRPVYVPSRPSPLGLSNYQAIDLEGDPFDEDEWDGAESAINSDFNIREPEDDLDSVGDTPSWDPAVPLFGLPPDPSDSSVWTVLAEENNQKEISLATFHTVLPA